MFHFILLLIQFLVECLCLVAQVIDLFTFRSRKRKRP